MRASPALALCLCLVACGDDASPDDAAPQATEASGGAAGKGAEGGAVAMAGKGGAVSAGGMGGAGVSGKGGSVAEGGAGGAVGGAGQGGAVAMAGQGGAVSMAGQGGAVAMAGQGGAVAMAGQGGAVAMAGQGGAVAMAGQGGAVAMGGSAGAGPAGPVDRSTATGKLLLGYQGWFKAKGDGSAIDQWQHWAPGVTPAPGALSFDAWPDLSELPPEWLFETDLHHADGSKARLYSAHDGRVVERHFAWMEEHELDGVFLQEFVVELDPGSPARAFRDKVTENVRAGAEQHGRVFAIEYDISGASEATVVDAIIAHWQAMVDAGIVGSDRYLWHRGRPLVAVWGFGFDDRIGTPQQAATLIEYFHATAPEPYRASVLGGVPSRWRNLDGDSKPDPAWLDVYTSYDIVNPWMVGRYANDADIEAFKKDRVAPDLALCAQKGADYMPVIWPGFSWGNLMPGSPFNQIPRRGGAHLWKQFFEFRSAGAPMFFGAMFDEVDEGTAMFKVASHKQDAPVDAQFLTLDADGFELPSDWYLRLCHEASRVLKGESALGKDLPITPPTPTCNPPDTELVGGKCVPSCGKAGGTSCDPAVCQGKPLLEAYDCAVCCQG